LSAANSFNNTLKIAQSRIDAVITSKLESFFELAEYNWTPKWPTQSLEPSDYVFEMITFLTAYVDSVLIGLGDETKTRAYENALRRINNYLMVCLGNGRQALTVQETLCSKEVPRLNEAALTMVLADIKFIEQEIQRMSRPGLDHVFDEVKLVSCQQDIRTNSTDAQCHHLRRRVSIHGAVYPAVILRRSQARPPVAHPLQARGWIHCSRHPHEGGTPSGGSGPRCATSVTVANNESRDDVTR
jgi:hypothetical protein